MANAKVLDQRSEFPKTHVQRRNAYWQILGALRCIDPLHAIARCRAGIETAAGRGRRPCDTRNVGTWLPQFALNALASTLKDAERRLTAERRRDVAHGSR